MPDSAKKPVILAFDGAAPQPLSIRARALVFSDPASQRLLEYIERIAPSEAPVLINGETGTGKELVARHIHLLSGRKGPFLAVNCGAITESLAESELFGHEAGSFTGAATRREGWFEAANGGTLFLDEIGDLPLALQVKLLRVVQEREVVRVGARRPVAVDVRLITATNVDLDQAVAAGHFRRDLHYRLNIAQVKLPPLRERLGDIIPLSDYFLGVYAHRMGLPTPALSRSAEWVLRSYPWPGNIRELENVLHFALLISPGGEILPEHLKIHLGNDSSIQTEPQESFAAVPKAELTLPQERQLDAIADQLKELFQQPMDGLFEKLEERIVREAFEFSGKNQVHAAQLLGITRNVMRTLLKRHHFILGGGRLERNLRGESAELLEGGEWPEEEPRAALCNS